MIHRGNKKNIRGQVETKSTGYIERETNALRTSEEQCLNGKCFRRCANEMEIPPMV